MQEGARGIRLAIAGYERVMEGADMRASVLKRVPSSLATSATVVGG